MRSTHSALTVLIVEDDLFQQSAIRALLQGLGVRKIFCVPDGAQAIEALGQWRFDVVLCDIDLPKLNGPALMQELRHRGKQAFLGEAPVWVWVSAMPEDIIYSHVRLVSAFACRDVHALRKPLTVGAIRPVLEAVLSRDAVIDPPGDESAVPDDMTLTEALWVDEGFTVVIQPQFNIASGNPVGAEALCRWRHPRGGMIAPDDFIPRLEALGHLETLFFFVLDRCLGVQRYLVNHGISMVIGINASAQTLCKPGWFERFEARVAINGISPRSLIIELTESCPVPDMCELAITLNRLRLRGYGVAIDDFGIGIASLELLADLPFTQMKLDRSFVSAIAEDNQRAVICRSQIKLAHDLGLECVAEGVETEVQRESLLGLGCEIGQGYLWSHPKSERVFLFDIVTGHCG